MPLEGRSVDSQADGTGTSGTNVFLSSIQFGTASNGLIDAGGVSGSGGNFTLGLPSGTTGFTFFIRRASPGAATTVPFTVNDSCGAWQTFAGGGPDAF